MTRSSKSTISIPVATHRVFDEAYALYKSLKLNNLPQLKYAANQDIHDVREGKMPGKRMKWIRREDNEWIFNLKYFALYDTDDDELRDRLRALLPLELREPHAVHHKKEVKRSATNQDQEFLLLLVENCLTDMVEILSAVRQKEINIELLRRVGVA
jgi:hypothetical protein